MNVAIHCRFVEAPNDLQLPYLSRNQPIIRLHSHQETNMLTCKLQWQTDKWQSEISRYKH